MVSIVGDNIKINLFGESHGNEVGVLIDNFPAGISINTDIIYEDLEKRSPNSLLFNTPRNEKNKFRILSGIKNKVTTGTPICIAFENKFFDSSSYDNYIYTPRPSHCDYVLHDKYKGFNDFRGGGHSSGRITIGIVIVGSILKQILNNLYPEMKIFTHIKKIGDIKDIGYYDIRKKIVNNLLKENNKNINIEYILENKLNNKLAILKKKLDSISEEFKISNRYLPLIDVNKLDKLDKYLRKIKKDKNTIGGELETIIFNPPKSLGEPLFKKINSYISSLILSIGTIKGIFFGDKKSFNIYSGDDVKDEIFYIDKNKIYTLYNYNGGINGGITNGEDIVINIFSKPISSIKKSQYSYNFKKGQLEKINIMGNHDVFILNRIIPIIESYCYISIFDLLIYDNMKDIFKN